MPITQIDHALIPATIAFDVRLQIELAPGGSKEYGKSKDSKIIYRKIQKYRFLFQMDSFKVGFSVISVRRSPKRQDDVNETVVQQ